MSHAYPRARPPEASISPAAPAAPSPSRSRIAIAQPSAASATASALPRLRAAPVTSAILPRIPRSILLPLEVRLALGEERLDAFRGVLGLERLEKRADLDVDRLVDRRVEPFVDRLDDEPGRDRRALSDRARERLRLVERLAFLRESVGEAERQALRRRYLRAQDQDLERLGPADQARHPLRAAEARRDAQVRLGLSHPRRFLHQSEVAGHRDLAAAAERVAVDRGDDGLGEPLDLAHHGVAESDEGVDVAAGEGRPQIGAGAEDAVARAGDDDRANRVVVLHRVERGVEVPDELDADRVGGRTVERDDREALLTREEQGLKRHGRSLPWERLSRPARPPR